MNEDLVTWLKKTPGLLEALKQANLGKAVIKFYDEEGIHTGTFSKMETVWPEEAKDFKEQAREAAKDQSVGKLPWED